jgi:CBS domain-containing protein
MGLMKIASVPPAMVAPAATVREASRLMTEREVGAVAVVEDDDELIGIFTSGDLARRVVAAGLDPDTTAVADVMTFDVEAVRRELPYGEALKTMIGRHFRHLPVVDAHHRVTGMVTVRRLLETRLDELANELNSVTAYFTADGPGG